MKLVTWIVALCNRKWQTKLDAMVMEMVVVEEPEPTDNDICSMMDVIDQPTHLAHTFQPRAKRKKRNTKPKPSAKEAALREAMDEEFKRLAEGR